MRKLILCFWLISLVHSCEELSGVTDISDDSVILLAPSNNSVLNTSPVTFTWIRLDGADSYHLQVATPSFLEASQVVIDTIISSTNFTDVLEINSYQWRVRAENFGYQTSYSTNTFSLE